MGHVPTPARPGVTPLYWWSLKAFVVADEFWRLADECRDQWLVGPLLTAGFSALYNLFYDIAGYCWNTDDAIRDKWGWVIGLTEGTTFREILDYFSYHYRSIRDDPAGWVKWRFVNISPSHSDFILNTFGWLRNKLNEQVSWYTTFRDNPSRWINEKLSEYWFWFRDFLNNPVWTIRSWMYQNVPALEIIATSPVLWIITRLNLWYSWFGAFLAHPRNYIIDFINDGVGWFWEFLQDPYTFVNNQIDAISYDLQRFIDDPSLYIRRKICNIVHISVSDSYDFAIAIWRKILDDILTHRVILENKMKNTIIEIILWFI